MIDKQKLKPISGFPEWLPEFRLVEQQWIDTIRGVFETYGFCSIDPRSVEPIDVLLKQGDTDKEIYAIERLFEDRPDAKPEFALHYDMTVPMARYIAAHMNDLVFPLKRYQIQRAWRGERPQEGRFREFYQCDIDVVDTRDLPLHFDAEIPVIVYEVMDRLGTGGVTTRLNNRKVLEGYYRGLGSDQPGEVMRLVDKLDKVGRDGVARLLSEELGMEAGLIDKVLALATISGTDAGVVEQVRALDVSHELLDEGLGELGFVMGELEAYPQGAFIADLSIARGLAYYTGTVYEAKLNAFPDYPTVCAGGRYDNLVGSLINRRLPGIGISIGLTRIFAKMVREGKIEAGRKTPTEVLVIYPRGAAYGVVKTAATALRARGIKTEQYHEDRKTDQQMKYALNKGIRYVWFPAVEPGDSHRVKDLVTGEQGGRGSRNLGVAMTEAGTKGRFTVIEQLLPEADVAPLRSHVTRLPYFFENGFEWKRVWHPLDSGAMAGTPVAYNAPGKAGRDYPTQTPFDLFFQAMERQRPAIAQVLDMPEEEVRFLASPYLYPVGSALSWHNDAGHYRGAFAYYLHETWKGNWGGELLILEEPRLKESEPGATDLDYPIGGFVEPAYCATGIGTFIMPVPNRLVVMGKGLLHRVSPVAPQAGENMRLSIAGFFL